MSNTGDKILDELLLDPDIKKLFAYSMKNKAELKLNSGFIRRMKFEKTD